jgi:O-antigen/teichoic acid export membrane protein
MTTWENQGREATEKLLTLVTRIYFIICLPSAIGLTVLASPLITLLAAPDYHEGSRIFGFVIFSSFAWGLSNIALMGLMIKRQTRHLALNQLIAASVHIVLAYLLISGLGYIAPAITTLIGFSVLLALQAIGSKPFITWRIPTGTLRNSMVASTVMGFVAWSMYTSFNPTKTVSPILLLLSTVTAAITYFTILYLLNEFQDSEREQLRQIACRLFRKDKESVIELQQ